jgi:dienelactone hydrolase
MAVVATQLNYFDGDTRCKGVYFSPENAQGPLPVVLVCHAWDGLIGEVRDKATKLADSGYIAFAIDVYGEGKTFSDMATQLNEALGPFMSDREMLLTRMQAALATAKEIPGADTRRIGAMGYCFGGMCILDLARAGGTELKAAVSFHGALIPNGLNNPATVDSKILCLHGYDDPMIPSEQVNAFMAEMTEKKADLQFVSYSNTVHAFTRPDANSPDVGAVYNPLTDRRSWQAMLSFFEEVL